MALQYVLRNYISNSFKNKKSLTEKLEDLAALKLFSIKFIKKNLLTINIRNILQNYLDKKKFKV